MKWGGVTIVNCKKSDSAENLADVSRGREIHGGRGGVVREEEGGERNGRGENGARANAVSKQNVGGG